MKNSFVPPSIFAREACFDLELMVPSSARHRWLFGDKFPHHSINKSLAPQPLNRWDKCNSSYLPSVTVQRQDEYFTANYYSFQPCTGLTKVFLSSPCLLCLCLCSAGILFLDGSAMWTRGQRDNSRCSLSRPSAFASRSAGISAVEVQSQSCIRHVQNSPPAWRVTHISPPAGMGLRADKTIRGFGWSMVRFVRWGLIKTVLFLFLFFLPDNIDTVTEGSGCGNIWMTPSEERNSLMGEFKARLNFLSTLKP